MTELDAKKVVAFLLVTFPSAKVEPPALDEKKQPIPNTGTAAAYARLLADLDPMIATAAIERVAGTHRYPTILPAVAEIREAYLALVAGEVRTGLEAWGDVERLMRRGFSSHKPPKATDVEDPIVFACIGDIGWRVLCMSDEDDSSPRARFIDSYDKRAASARRDTLTRTLPSVRRVLALRAGEEEQALEGDRRAASTFPIRRALLALAAHPAAASDPDAQRALAAAQNELRRRGQQVSGPVALGGLLDGVLPREGGGR